LSRQPKLRHKALVLMNLVFGLNHFEVTGATEGLQNLFLSVSIDAANTFYDSYLVVIRVRTPALWTR
jgi:hypothetical protein